MINKETRSQLQSQVGSAIDASKRENSTGESEDRSVLKITWQHLIICPNPICQLEVHLSMDCPQVWACEDPNYHSEVINWTKEEHFSIYVGSSKILEGAGLKIEVKREHDSTISWNCVVSISKYSATEAEEAREKNVIPFAIIEWCCHREMDKLLYFDKEMVFF